MKYPLERHNAENALAEAAEAALLLPELPQEYIREKKVENRLRSLAKKHQDICMLEKHESPGRRGVPDDLITWGYPLCLMELIETKAPKGERKKHQTRDHEKRARLGIKVHTLYTVEEIDAYFNLMLKLMSLT